MKCERCKKELSGVELYCPRCGQAVFPEYMDDEDVWAYYKSDEELSAIMDEESETEAETEITAKPVEKLETEIEAEAETEWDTEMEAGAEMEPETEIEIEAEAETEPGSEIEAEIETEPETAVEAEAETESETEIEAETETESETELEVESEFKPEAEFEAEQITEESESAEDDIQDVLSEEIEEAAEPDGDADDEDMDDDEDSEDEDEEVSEEKPKLTEGERRRRRMNISVAVVFLAACLSAGVLMGVNKMKAMEKQEKEYYKQIKKKEIQTDAPQEPQQKTQEEPAVDDAQDVQEAVPQEQTPQEPPAAEEPKKEEYFQMVNADEIDFSQFAKIQPVSAEGNSTNISDKYNYGAESAVDGDIKSSWQEGEDGLGEGKGFKLNLDGPHKIRYIVLYLGNWRSDELWAYNAKPQVLTMQVGDGQQKDVEFSKEKKRFCLSFDEPLEASYISMYIKSGYAGDRWNDNCISEVEIYE